MPAFSEVGVKATVEGLNKFTKDLGKMSTTATVSAAEIDDSFSKAAREVIKATDKMFLASTKSVSDIGEEVDKTSKTYVDANGRMRDANGRFVKSADSTKKSVGGVGNAFDDTTKDAKEFGTGLTGVQGITTGFGKKISGLAKVITIGLGTALGNIITGGLNLFKNAVVGAGQAVFDLGKESIDMAADFQQQVALLGIAAGDSGLQFDELKAAALAVGGDIRLAGVSSTGAADAMTALFKAGLNTTTIFGDLNAFMNEGAELGGALRAAIDLAAASELDMAQAADLSAVVLSTFGDAEATAAEQAEFVNFALNNMVKAADASVADVSDLAAALTNVGPTAAAAGLDLDEVNTALAILSTRGIRGAEAGTALKSAIANMRRPTAAVQGELDKWGISLFDAEGNMFDMVEIIGQFEIALGDATDEQKAQAIQTIAGTFGMNAMNALLDEGVGGWAAMQQAMEGAADIQTQAQARTQTFNGMMEALEGTVETLKIQIGDALLPVASDLVTWFTEVVSIHGPAITGIMTTIGEGLKNFAGFILGVVEDGDSMNDFLANFSTEAKPFVKFIGDIVLWLKDFLPVAIETAITFIKSLATTIATKFTEFMVVIQPIIDAVISFFNEKGPGAAESFKIAFGEAWGFIQGIIDTFIVWFEENGPLIIETGQTIVDFWETNIVPALDNIWEIIKTAFGAALDNILLSATIFMQLLNGDWEGAWDNIKLLFAQTGLALLKIWDEFLEGVLNAFGSTSEEFKATWATNWEQAKLALGLFMLKTITDLQNWLEQLQTDIANFFVVLIISWIENWEAIKLIFGTFMLDTITDLNQWLEDIQVDITNFFVAGILAWKENWNSIKLIFGTFVLDTITMLNTWLEDIQVNLTNFFVTLILSWQGNWDNIVLIFTTAWDNIKTTITTKIESITTALTTFITNIKNAATPVVEIVKGLIDKLASLFDKLEEGADKLPDWMKPGSPPPLFFALQDINRAMNELTSKQLPRMSIELDTIAPKGGAFLAAPTMAAAGATMSASPVMQNTVNINQNNNISGGMGMAAVEGMVMNIVNRALGTGTR